MSRAESLCRGALIAGLTGGIWTMKPMSLVLREKLSEQLEGRAMLAFIGSKLTKNLARLGDGSLLCRNVVIGRSGIQLYRPDELGIDGSSEKLIRVERPESEVLSPETMASFEGVTLLDDHPGSGFITPASWRGMAMGHVQNIRPGPRVDGDATLIGDLIVNDSQLIEKILSGTRREVSCGYDCQYVPTDGGSYRQQMIRGNHVAVVRQGRAHNARIMDGGKMEIDWKRPETLYNLNATQALTVLGQISEAFKRTETHDQNSSHDQLTAKLLEDRRLDAMDATPEARAFCDSANALGRRLRSAKDCRPSLREKSEAKLTADEEFAAACREYHRR
jgi:hypothetical protein